MRHIIMVKLPANKHCGPSGRAVSGRPNHSLREVGCALIPEDCCALIPEDY
jgi:hypothetical protein